MTWRQIQKDNFTHWSKLADFLELDVNKRSHILQHPTFPLNLPRRLANKISKNTLNDPLLLQFLPLDLEEKKEAGFIPDPVSDQSFQKTSRLLHKYPGRALLVCTSACAMHCRFCFRQNYPYEKQTTEFEKELEQLANDSSIFEVILSGGDPLSLNDEKLKNLIEALEKIPHLKLLRFHTRFPLGIPERITRDFLSVLEKSHLQTYFILHINHPKELDEDVTAALKKIGRLGIPLLSQMVLLKNVNDQVEILSELFLNLIQVGITPYYLHQLDQVQGTGHFEVPISKGQKLLEILRERLPGYAIPTYVQEIPFKKSKTALHAVHGIKTQDIKSLF